MIIRKVKPDWWIVQFNGLTFFGRDYKLTVARAYAYHR